MGWNPKGRTVGLCPSSFCSLPAPTPNRWSTDAAKLRKLRIDFPFGASIWRAPSSRWEMRLPDLTHGFLVSFAEPGAIAPVLIPLDTYGEGFYAIASLV
jgi:hypothetical protein